MNKVGPSTQAYKGAFMYNDEEMKQPATKADLHKVETSVQTLGTRVRTLETSVQTL